MRVKGGNRAEEADVRGRLGHAGGAARGGGSRRRQASDGPDHVPRRVIDLPDQALARNAGVGFDSIAALSPGIPSHAEPGGGSCDKDVDLTSTIHGMAHIAALDTGICDNADIDHYTQGTQRYVVIAGAGDAAWTHINVTNPASPTVVAQYVWTRRAKATRSPDIKAFQQGSNRYVALSTEIGGNNSTCGLFIFDVTDPGNAVQLSRTLESGVWCSVHNAYVEVDGNGDGTHVYITANSSADLRAYSIANPAAPVKVGTYQRQVRGFGGPGTHDDIYVHDVTVEDGTVYASYWEAGLDMMPSSLLRGRAVVSETNGQVSNIDPPNFTSGNPFLVHHAFPNGTGSLVALEDEIEIANGAPVVQLWTTAGAHVDDLVEGTDVPVLPATTSTSTTPSTATGCTSAGTRAGFSRGRSRAAGSCATARRRGPRRSTTRRRPRRPTTPTAARGGCAPPSTAPTCTTSCPTATSGCWWAAPPAR